MPAATTALILLHEGFETLEACAPLDILRRAKVEVTVASCGESLQVKSGQGLTVVADAMVDDVKSRDYDVVILPGGLPNAKLLGQDQRVVEIIKKQDSANKLLAAICASPACVLAANGLLNNRKAVGYPAPEFTNLLASSLLQPPTSTHVDHHIITANGPGSAVEFAFLILKCLKIESDAVKKGMLFA